MRRVGSLSWRQLYQQLGTDPTKARVASLKTREGDLYLDQLMYEIKVADLATDSPDFGVVSRAALDRYDRLYKQHVPDGRLLYRRDASQREIVAGTYTAIVLTHAQVAASAFQSKPHCCINRFGTSACLRWARVPA